LDRTGLEEDHGQDVRTVSVPVLGQDLVVAPQSGIRAVVHETDMIDGGDRVDDLSDGPLQSREGANELRRPHGRVPVDREGLKVERRPVRVPDPVRGVRIAQDIA